MLKFDVKIPTRRSKNFFLGFEGRNFNNFFRILRTLRCFSYLVKRSHFVSPTAWYSHLAMLGNFKFGLGPLNSAFNPLVYLIQKQGMRDYVRELSYGVINSVIRIRDQLSGYVTSLENL